MWPDSLSIYGLQKGLETINSSTAINYGITIITNSSSVSNKRPHFFQVGVYLLAEGVL